MATADRLKSADWLTLTDGEEIEWTGRPSLFTVAPQLIGTVAVGFLGGLSVSALQSVLSRPVPAIIHALPLLAGVSLLGLVLLGWYRVQYVITSNEVYIKRGLVSRDIAQIRLSRIQNTTRSQSVLERLLGYGDVVAYTAGSETMNIEFKSVPNPSQVTDTLSELLGRPDTEPTKV